MSDLMSAAIDLMLVGMGFVFIFLTILVFVTISMSRLVTRFSGNALHVENKPSAGSLSNSNSNDLLSDTRLKAVLTAAVAKYRAENKP